LNKEPNNGLSGFVFEGFGKNGNDLEAMNNIIFTCGLIAQHKGGIDKGFAYGWEENVAHPISFLGAHFVKDNNIPLSL
jgi:hypothetical protein